MPPYERINAYRPPRRGPWRRRFSAALPWVFVAWRGGGDHAADAGLGALALVAFLSWDSQAARDAESILKRAGSPDTRHAVDVIRTIDGDTFEARVHLEPGLDLNTRVRLRGIDAPEVEGVVSAGAADGRGCDGRVARNAQRRRAGSSRLGRTNMPAASSPTSRRRRTGNVSTAMLAAGHARSYGGGHRNGWCANAGQTPLK